MAQKFKTTSLILGSQIVTTTGDSIFVNGVQAGGTTETASNLGVGSGLFNSKVGNDLQFKSLSVGTGLFISGSLSNLQVNTYFGQKFMTGLQLTSAIPSVNTYVNILSGNVGPGTWMTFSQASVRTKPASTGVTVTAKLWSGAGAFFALENSCLITGLGTSGHTSLSMNGLITTITPSTPITLSCASNVNNCQVVPAPTTNLTAGIPSGVSTYIHMVRLY